MKDNNKPVWTYPLGLLLVLGILGTAPAATYYIDFEAGRDDNAGTAPDKALKHCPGDPAAADSAAKMSLAPGDTVIFKGGVNYRGAITINWAGTKEKPITYDGNSAGKFGQGQAIIDGSELLTGWTACASAEECGGNPNWKNIYTAWVPGDTDPFGANLFENDRMLWVAQEPRLKDPFYIDDLATFRHVPKTQATTTTLADPANLNQTDAHYWDGATMLIWGKPNEVYLSQITAFDPVAHQLTFVPVKGFTETYPDRNTLYALANSIHVLNTPGEFVVSNEKDAQGRRKVYLWPLTAGAIDQQNITVSVRRKGLTLEGASYVHLRGLIVQKQGGPDQVNAIYKRPEGEIVGLVISDCEVRWCRSREVGGTVGVNNCRQALVDGNRIHDNCRMRGLGFWKCTDSVASNNLLDKNGGTGLYFYICKHSRMIQNTVTRHNGVHANGLTVYHFSDDILVFGNKVSDSNIALTTQSSSNVTVAYNLMTGRDGYIVADWNGCDGLRYFNNVIVADQGDTSVSIGPQTRNVTFQNNICTGNNLELLRAAGKLDLGHNIYTSSNPRGGKLEAGSLIADLATIFVDPAKRDYRLKAGSPAIGAGVAVGLDKDLVGARLPQGKAPDIGVYQYSAAH